MPDMTAATIEVVLEFFYSDIMPDPLPLETAVAAFLGSRKIGNSTLEYQLMETICEGIRDSNRFLKPSGLRCMWCATSAGIHYNMEIGLVSRLLSELIKDGNTTDATHQFQMVLKEIKARGIASDVLRDAPMQQLINGPLSTETFKILRNLLAFYYENKEDGSVGNHITKT